MLETTELPAYTLLCERTLFSRRLSVFYHSNAIQEMPGFSLFPGQIIMAYGTNSSGRRMLAQKIIEGVNAPLPSTSPGQLLEYHYGPAYQGGAV